MNAKAERIEQVDTTKCSHLCMNNHFFLKIIHIVNRNLQLVFAGQPEGKRISKLIFVKSL